MSGVIQDPNSPDIGIDSEGDIVRQGNVSFVSLDKLVNPTAPTPSELMQHGQSLSGWWKVTGDADADD